MEQSQEQELNHFNLGVWKAPHAPPLPWGEVGAPGSALLRRPSTGSAPGEGLRPNEKPEPLTPNPLPIEVGYIRLRQQRCPSRVNPRWVGEGAHLRCRKV